MNATTCDVIIIGSGIGGLTAAATLAKEGMSVRVFEQFHRLGGFGQSYKIDGYHFDTAIHAMWLWEDISEIIKEFGIELEFVTARRADRILLKDQYELWATSIPEMKQQIQKMATKADQEVEKYYDQLIKAQEVLVTLMNNPNNPQYWSKFFKYKHLWKMTLEDVVTTTVTDPLARSLIFGYHDSYLYDYGWHYPAYHLYCTKYLYDSFQPVGGSQPLVDALVQAIERMGGELRTNAAVKKIIVEQNESKGIMLENGEIYYAKKAIISNADAILTFEKMIGRDTLPKDMIEELDKWLQYVPSLSYYILNIGLDIDVKKKYDLKGDLTVYYPQINILDGLKKINNGKLDNDFWLWMVFPSFNDPNLAPPGHSVAIFSILVPYDCENFSHISKDYSFNGFHPDGKKGEEYYRFKEELIEKILARAEEVYPGIASHVVVKDMITPQTIERITLNFKGSTLGAISKPVLKQAPMKGFNLSIGFKKKTSINKLYLAGGWTESGFSASAVIGCGRDVAFDILGKRGKGIAINPAKRLARLKNMG